jgi:hypothetical protein
MFHPVDLGANHAFFCFEFEGLEWACRGPEYIRAPCSQIS